MVACSQASVYVPRHPSISPKHLVRPQAHRHWPPAPPPYAQHFPCSLSPPDWGGGQSLLPISAEEFITGTAGPCWGGQATRKINLFLPNPPAQGPSLSQLAGRDSPLLGSAGGLQGALQGGSFANPNASQSSVFRLLFAREVGVSLPHVALGQGGFFSAHSLGGGPPNLCPGAGQVRGHHPVLAWLNLEAPTPFWDGCSHPKSSALPPSSDHPPVLMPIWGSSSLLGHGRGRRTQAAPSLLERFISPYLQTS